MKVLLILLGLWAAALIALGIYNWGWRYLLDPFDWVLWKMGWRG